MVLKWALVMFAVAALVLVVVSKATGLLYPPDRTGAGGRRGRWAADDPLERPRGWLLRRRLTRTVAAGVLLGLLLLALAVLFGP
jgi:hypothetical protein